MEVEAAARRMLMTDPTVNGYVSGKVWKWRIEEMDALDGTGGLAVVVWTNGGWGKPDTVKTDHFPLLVVDCYADPSRDADGAIAEADARDKARALYRACDRLIHGQKGVRWGAVGSNPGLQVISAARWTEPYDGTDRDRHGRGVPLGDLEFVSAAYALNVVH